jgi:(p)ppGpp synthase/HD superfamily hydrolase
MKPTRAMPMNKPGSLWCQDAYREALFFAADRHSGQTYPGTSLPYLVHLTAVCMEVMAALWRETVASPDLCVQCALLHDVVEDTPTGTDEVSARFGPDVAAGVDALSKRESAGPTKTEKMADSLTRIQAQPREIWMVKLADRITNMHDPPAHWSIEKRRRYRAEAGTILDTLGASSPYLAARLQEKIKAYQKFIH